MSTNHKVNNKFFAVWVEIKYFLWKFKTTLGYRIFIFEGCSNFIFCTESLKRETKVSRLKFYLPLFPSFFLCCQIQFYIFTIFLVYSENREMDQFPELFFRFHEWQLQKKHIENHMTTCYPQVQRGHSWDHGITLLHLLLLLLCTTTAIDFLLLNFQGNKSWRKYQKHGNLKKRNDSTLKKYKKEQNQPKYIFLKNADYNNIFWS